MLSVLNEDFDHTLNGLSQEEKEKLRGVLKIK